MAINIEAAEAAISQIKIGSKISGDTYEALKVLDKSAFGVTLKRATDRITVPIETTEIYKKEVRMSIPTNIEGSANPAATRGRGRPRRTTSEAPIEQPVPPAANNYLPPGSNYGGVPGALQQHAMQATTLGVASVHTRQPAQPGLAAEITQVETRVLQTAQPVELVYAAVTTRRVETAKEPQMMTIEQAQDDPNWTDTSLNDALDRLREHFVTIIDGVRKDAEEQLQTPEPEAVIRTCWNCVYVDKAAGNCSKFNMVPPMHVICDPKKHCPEFMFDEEIPF